MTEQKSKLIYAQLKNGNTYESSAYFVYYEDEEGAEISPWSHTRTLCAYHAFGSSWLLLQYFISMGASNET